MSLLSKIIISLISSGTVLSSFILFLKNRNYKKSKLMALEQKKLDFIFQPIDAVIHPFLFLKPEKKSTAAFNLPNDFQKALKKLQTSLDDNPDITLAVGTRFKEKLSTLISLDENTSSKRLIYEIEMFSFYYCFELKQCKKICGFPKYSIVYPKDFYPKLFVLVCLFNDFAENILYITMVIIYLFTFSTLIFYFLYQI